jgi:predicted nucleic acid-binding protein
MSDDRPRLIDTNILVYAYDISEKEKHSPAKSILKKVQGITVLNPFLKSSDR